LCLHAVSQLAHLEIEHAIEHADDWT
jgi:hypothetical protein